MPHKEDQALLKGQVFFERARKVAETGNFDYAIELYIDGLRCAPDALKQGHLKLRSLGIVRQSKGGKKPTMVEKVKHMGGKAPLDCLLNAEYLFAKDPEHLAYAESMLKASAEAGYRKTAKWIADLLFQANNTSKKPSLHTYLLLKECYAKVDEFERALIACQKASELKPQDGELADEFKRLSAELTVARGKYDQSGDFRDSIKNREEQEKRQSQQSLVKTDDYRQIAAKEARAKYAKDPETPQNIFNLASALADLETDDSTAEAIKLLENTYKKISDFSYQKQAGVLIIKQLKRKIRKLQNFLDSNPDDETAKNEHSKLVAELNKVELDHYRNCTKNYPTDLQIKYEYGIRLIQNKQYDDAIPLFQDSQKDPRRKIASLNKIGLCFFLKGWFSDAIDIFLQAIDSCEIKDDSISKELRYNLARSYEEQGDNKNALELYRKLAQLDFTYKDVRQRVNKIRSFNSESEPK